MTTSRFALAAAALVASFVVQPRSRDAQSEQAPTPSLLVSADWLVQHLRDSNLVLLHVGDRPEYDAGHIPGARYVTQGDISISSHDHDNGLMLEMPSADSLKVLLEKLGISNGSRVVVYYGNDWVSPSTRVMFTLANAGLAERSSLLDGGMQQWIASGHAVTKEVPELRVGSLSPLRLQNLVVDVKWVQQHLRTKGYAIVDGRSASFYDGVEATGPRKGHIPGARSIPFTEVADDKNRIKSVEELRALFDRAGVQPRDTVIGYCHIGQQATAMLFAARILGHPVRLYDGSMQEWSRRTDLPIEAPGDSQ
ncbi:MAG TPA: sulfurtransferase [Gemmatimonadaceae bacterium]|nr:sulfurtransferase [Gemmatimonadaceae bacterium]